MQTVRLVLQKKLRGMANLISTKDTMSDFAKGVHWPTGEYTASYCLFVPSKDN